MRRDNFTVTVELPDAEPDPPTLVVAYTGPTATLTAQLTGEDGDPYPATEIDAAFRLQDSLEAADPTGVFSLTHRVTGEYLLEVNVPAETVLDLVGTARDADGDAGSYRVRIEREDDPLEHEMDALFVYDSQGDLLRQHSLIPSGVEL
jgi:hypothetical protein